VNEGRFAASITYRATTCFRSRRHCLVATLAGLS
jgi:hypothetical protein